MPFDNWAPRQTMRTEKSHSLSFSVRVEDRLHVNILDELADTCWFTVRPEAFKVGQDDTDLDAGNEPATGVGFRVDGIFYERSLSIEEQAELSPAEQELLTRESRLFLFEVQAAALDLDPEQEWFYDISYAKDGYSVSISSGALEVGANPSNGGAELDFTGTGDTYRVVSTLDGRNLINVSTTLPMPQDGPAGLSTYYTTDELSGVVGNSRNVLISTVVLPLGRTLLVGDMVYSSVTTGTLAVVDDIDWQESPAVVTLRTVQRFGIDGINALTYANVITGAATGGDPSYTTATTPAADWTVDKAKVPLPDDNIHEYHIGDLVIGFARSSTTPGAPARVFVALIKQIFSTQLTLTTKYKVDLLDSDSIGGLLLSKADAEHAHEIADTTGLETALNAKVPTSRTINGKALTGNVALTPDDFTSDGTSYKRFSAADKTKLGALPEAATLTTQLDAKVGSDDIDTIRVMTLAAYTALAVKDSRTQYLIVG